MGVRRCKHTGRGLPPVRVKTTFVPTWIRELQADNKKLNKRILELESGAEVVVKVFTVVDCDIESCTHRREKGMCNQAKIELQGCAPDADNVVACSRFFEG